MILYYAAFWTASQDLKKLYAALLKYWGFYDTLYAEKNGSGRKWPQKKGMVSMKKLLQEFKEFISRGNVLDMAVGVVIA